MGAAGGGNLQARDIGPKFPLANRPVGAKWGLSGVLALTCLRACARLSKAMVIGRLSFWTYRRDI